MDTELMCDTMPATELGFGLTLHGDFMDDSAFVEQLLHEAQPYDFEPALWSCYNTSGIPAWSLPYDSMAYGKFQQQNNMSTSASSVVYESSITSMDTLNSCAEQSLATMSADGSSMSEQSGSPEAKDLSSVIALFPEPPAPASPVKTQSPERPPRMRSANSNRRSKYKCPKSTSNASSDDDSVLARPAHYKAERNYRRRLNSSFEKLLEVMNMVAPKDSISLHDKEIGKDLSKSDILHLASLRLIAMERENQRLREQLEQTRVGPQRAVSWSSVETAGY